MYPLMDMTGPVTGLYFALKHMTAAVLRRHPTYLRMCLRN